MEKEGSRSFCLCCVRSRGAEEEEEDRVCRRGVAFAARSSPLCENEMDERTGGVNDTLLLERSTPTHLMFDIDVDLND